MAKSLKKPDPILVKDQLTLLRGMANQWGIPTFSTYMLWILTKKIDNRPDIKRHSRLVPFTWNPIQHDVYSKMGLRNICLKPRQVGLTTWFTLVRLFLPSMIEPGTNSLLISQNGEYASKHFSMLRRAYKLFGAKDPANPDVNTLTKSLHSNLLHTAYSNRRELILDQLDNTIHIASAEVEETGQGITLHRVVCSETARWPGTPEETLANLKEAIVLGGTLDLESTANGLGGYFFEEYQRAERAESDFVAHFHPWWWQPEYRIALTDEQSAEMEADLAEDERKLMYKFHLELEQIAFRREKKKSLRHNFDEKYPEDAITCFLISGSTYFDKEIVRARLMELADLIPVRSFAGGSAKIFKARIPGRRYIIGADPASGRQVGTELDSSAAVVIDYDTGEQVASYMEQLSPEDFALDLEQLGVYYNNALIGVERGTAADSGGDGGSTLTNLFSLGYPSTFYFPEILRNPDTRERKVTKSPGFPTNGTTRVVILNKLKFLMETSPELFYDSILLKQCLVFVRDERGRPAAAEGAHDDMVLAAAIAHGVRMVDMGLWEPLLRYKRPKYGDTPREDAAEEELV